MRLFVVLVGVAALAAVVAASATQAGPAVAKAKPKFSEAKAFDVSKPLREIADAKPSSIDKGALARGPKAWSSRTQRRTGRSRRAGGAGSP